MYVIRKKFVFRHTIDSDIRMWECVKMSTSRIIFFCIYCGFSVFYELTYVGFTKSSSPIKIVYGFQAFNRSVFNLGILNLFTF